MEQATELRLKADFENLLDMKLAEVAQAQQEEFRKELLAWTLRAERAERDTETELLRQQQMQLDECKQAIQAQRAENAALRAELGRLEHAKGTTSGIVDENTCVEPREGPFWSLNALGALALYRSRKT
jgi:hypothetical protein